MQPYISHYIQICIKYLHICIYMYIYIYIYTNTYMHMLYIICVTWNVFLHMIIRRLTLEWKHNHAEPQKLRALTPSQRGLLHRALFKDCAEPWPCPSANSAKCEGSQDWLPCLVAHGVILMSSWCLWITFGDLGSPHGFQKYAECRGCLQAREASARNPWK